MNIRKIIGWIFTVGCALLTVFVLFILVFGSGDSHPPMPAPAEDVSIMNAFDQCISDALVQAKESALSVKKKFWIDGDALSAPVPDQNCYGQADDPSDLQWLMDDASALLDGQDTLFSTDIEIMPRSKIHYYLDETIFAVVWKQVYDNYVYTIAEVKISDPSQLRRYVADGIYDSPNRYTTTQMSEMTNAVVASSGDYYRTRRFGIIVYDGEVKRIDNPYRADTCYVDENGDLIFSYRGEITDMESAQKFVDEHNIDFSLAFGPVLVDNGVRCEPENYAIGEINDHYPRAAFGQKDELHYVVVVANMERNYCNFPTIHTFAKNLETMNCEKFYALDGGQTGVIAINNQCINVPQFGYQRSISDMFYFATAIPDKD